MAIGNHTFWIIVFPGNDCWEALTPPNDKRRALQFISYDKAMDYYIKQGCGALDARLVRVPA